MSEWEAPAKLNLDLRVGARDAAGLHPLRSLVQAVEWSDLVVVEEGEEDHLDVAGADVPEGGENLVWKAVEAFGFASRPRLHIRLDKRIPVAAGLGGGSSDAAAALRAVADLVDAPAGMAEEVAARVGADVPFFLTGGTARMEGHGEILTSLPPLEGFAVGVVVPPYQLSTADVYRRWDEMDGPVGQEVSRHHLPPALRAHGELRNDLTPAACILSPELGDWMQELSTLWERPVFMSGSGPASFAYFLDHDEAEGAVGEVTTRRAATATVPRSSGVSRLRGSDSWS